MYKVSIDSRNNKVNGISRLADNAWIPLDPANTDYQKYLEWLAEGNEPLQPDNNQ